MKTTGRRRWKKKKKEQNHDWFAGKRKTTTKFPFVHPPLLEQQANVTTVVGAKVTLKCKYLLQYGKSDTPRYLWVKRLKIYGRYSSSSGRRYHTMLQSSDWKNSSDPSTLVLHKVSAKDAGWYTCKVVNNVASAESDVWLTVEEIPEVNSAVIYGPITGILFFIIAMVSIVYKLWQQRHRKTRMDVVNSGRVVHFQKMNIAAAATSHVLLQEESPAKCLSVGLPSETFLSLPEDKSFEFSRKCLDFKECLGIGQFGKVVRALAKGISKRPGLIEVAVKMLKDGDDSDITRRYFLQEMDIMKNIGHHENIINLLGCCTQQGPLYIIVEYACHGNLRDYLIKIQNGVIPYISLLNSIDKSFKQCCGKFLANCSLQVACGMEYLALKQCIHRDLAARNVLVAEGQVMKIADFGLARKLDLGMYYMRNSQTCLPWKWTAPEALYSGKHTHQADVWSFGILLWEIYSLGVHPYPKQFFLHSLHAYLKRGERMSQPTLAPDKMYKMMLECWREAPEERPTFCDLHTNLKAIIELLY